MILGKYVKKPTEIGDYDVDLTPWLRQGEAASGAVGSAVCTTDPNDTALQLGSITVTDTALRVRVSGGAAGRSYLVTLTVTSSSGRTEDAEFMLAVEDPAARLTYHDAYLAPLVTPEREARALSDVDAIASFPSDWRARLAVARAYVITATESQRTPDDLFAAKAKQYRAEFTSLLPLARAKADEVSGAVGKGSLVSIGWERA